MNGITREDLQQWLTERFAEVLEEGAISIVGCLHYSASGSETPIHAISSKSPAEMWNPAKVAETMDVIATRHARGLPGVNQYALVATYGSSGRPRSSCPFQRLGQTSFGNLPGGGFATEGAHPTGIMGTAQRWGELTIQSAAAKDQLVTSVMGQLLDKLLLRLETTERRSDERWLALQGLLSSWQQQAMNSQLRALGVEAGRKLIPLIPAALSTLTGNDSLVPAAAVQESIFDSLVENYSGAQLQELLGSMPSGDAGSAVGALVADQLVRAKRRKAARDQERSEGSARTLEESELDAAGRAMRVLGGQQQPAPANHGARIVQALEHATNGSNGNSHNGHANGNGHTPKSTDPASDAGKAALFDDLVRAVPQAHALLVSALDEQAPELAARLKAHLAATGGRGQ